jgi:hypothetical protein
MHLPAWRGAPDQADPTCRAMKIHRARPTARRFVKIDYFFIVNGAAAQAVLVASSSLQRQDRLPQQTSSSLRAHQKEDKP